MVTLLRAGFGPLQPLLHADHGGGVAALELWPVVVVVGLAIAYVTLAVRQRREPRGWSAWRMASFLTGAAVLVVAVVPQLSLFPAGDFRGHMHQHLLIGMYAPLGLVMGAPITVVLRSVPPRYGRQIGRFLRSPVMHVIAQPVVALGLNLGGLVVLYFTPLYVATTHHPVLHQLVHLHFLAAGYLFTWVVAGPDPAPRRPSVPTRLVVLGVAITGHAVIAQLLYAGAYVQVPVPTAELRGGGDLMYYGGDIAELLIAVALVVGWRPHRRPSDRSRPDRRPSNRSRPDRRPSNRSRPDRRYQGEISPRRG